MTRTPSASNRPCWLVTCGVRSPCESNTRCAGYPSAVAFCKYLGVSVAGFYGQKIEKMPTSVTIGIKNVAETLEEAPDIDKMSEEETKHK